MPLARVNDTELYYVEHGKGLPCLVMHGGMGFDHTYLHLWLDPLGDAWTSDHWKLAANHEIEDS